MEECAEKKRRGLAKSDRRYLTFIEARDSKTEM